MIHNVKNFNLVFLVYIVLLNAETFYASPLIFKTTKEVTSTNLFDLGSFDTSKYRQVRITIKQANKLIGSQPLSKVATEIELNAAKRELERNRQLLEAGVVSRAYYDDSADRLKIAQANYDNAVETVYPPMSIYGIEGTEEILLASFDGKSLLNTIVIESPPTKISVKVFGRNTYKVFAWASL